MLSLMVYYEQDLQTTVQSKCTIRKELNHETFITVNTKDCHKGRMLSCSVYSRLFPRVTDRLCPTVCLWRQSASIFMFDKRLSGKMLRPPKTKDAVMEMLRADVSRLMAFRSPPMLRVMHPVEECR